MTDERTEMSVEHIVSRIRDIKALSDDCQAAHLAEDALYLDTLCAIAYGKCEDPKASALWALEASKLKFSRWYA